MSNIAKTSQLFPSFASLWDDFFNKELFDWGKQNGSALPSVNVKETDKQYSIEFAAPGLKKEDFKIEVDSNMLTVSSEKKAEKEEKDKEGKYLRREFSYQSFQRSFALPENCDRDSIDAAYAEGILHISIAKKTSNPNTLSKTIAVK